MRGAPPVCTAFWNAQDWANWDKQKKKAEPVSLECAGLMMLATGERDEKGNKLYRPAREEEDEFGGKQFLMIWA